MRVLFWNTHRNHDINSILCSLIVENRISVVVLAEYEGNINDLISKVKKNGVVMARYISVGCDRIEVLGSEKGVSPGPQQSHFSFQIFDNDIVLCAVHFPSSLYDSAVNNRKVEIRNIAREICSYEDKIEIRNTVLVGDFNFNPYDAECLDIDSLNSHPTLDHVCQDVSNLAGNQYRAFYNPMWNFFGDFRGPCGTYYYNHVTNGRTSWNILDQVMIRPSLRERFVDEELRIISEFSTSSLLDRAGHPDKRISDHLPIVFEIQEG